MRHALVLLGALLSPLILSACSVDAPSIVSISPGRDARDVPTNQEIRIAFDRPMNHQSVESRFQLRPALNGCQPLSPCSLAWHGNALVYTHAHVNLRLDTRYDVLLHGGYSDASGKQNALEHTWSFFTETAPALTAVDPPDGALSVAPDHNIVLTFNRPMDLGSLKAAINLSPEVPYLIRARPGGDGSQVEVVPTELLHTGAVYSVGVQGAFDTHGNPLPARLTSSFSVGAASYARRIAYLISGSDRQAFGVAIVDPHPDPFLNRSTPKILYRLPDGERAGRAIIAFDWAPDGLRLVLAVGPRGAQEGTLRLVDLRTGEVTDLPSSGSAVAWSPDGSAIAYLSQQTLHVYRPATLDDLALTHGEAILPPLAFTPDGKSIAYAVQEARGPRLQILNLDLRSSYRPIGLQDPADQPAWSYDGTKLAFRRLTLNGPQLWVYDLSGGGSTYREEASLDVASTAWLNDNSTLIATVGSGLGGVLYRINVFAPTEAGGLLRLTGAPGAPGGMAPSTSAYDRRIAFIAIIADLPQLFVMNGDGSGPAQLTLYEPDFPYTAQAANWNPLG